MKVLLADPSEQVCERLEKLLRDVDGLRIVGKAHTSLDTVRMVEQFKPDVVIAEILMNDGSGLTAVRQVKQEMSAPIIVIMTNSANSYYRQKFLDAGAEFFFDKSFEVDKVLTLMTELQVLIPSLEKQEIEL